MEQNNSPGILEEIEYYAKLTILPGEKTPVFNSRGRMAAIIRKKGFGFLCKKDGPPESCLLNCVHEVHPDSYDEFFLSCEDGDGAEPLEVLIIWFKK